MYAQEQPLPWSRPFLPGDVYVLCKHDWYPPRDCPDCKAEKAKTGYRPRHAKPRELIDPLSAA